MPVIQISVLPLPVEKKKELSKVFTDEMHRITGIPKEAMVIMFQELPAESFATNGEMLTEQLKRREEK
ncbi:MAG: 4-oxalocrotonate tautomerase [Bacteroidetes bacterium HGW-Bacteroidetes-6]|jgi:4-oxalocrotonate tautomerase family enzyme|nr:MAG: 4-oxalocrotonate tautomerase [Bacteroidetes bacterium HGW-Bacteroidetes-6]